MSKKLHDQLFNLKFTAKQLGRNSKKALKNEKAEKKKLKKAIEKGPKTYKTHCKSAATNMWNHGKPNNKFIKQKYVLVAGFEYS